MPAPVPDFAPLLQDAPFTEGLRALALRGEPRRLRRGHLIINEGDLGDSLYLVVQGRLRAFSIGADEREVTYSHYGPGDYVGEMGLDGGPRSANVVAEESSLVVVVTRRTLEAHLAEHPEFAFELLAKVIRLARTATRGLRAIALNDVYGRLKALLESLGGADAAGRIEITPAPSHLEMSRMIGCGREMVSRVMKDLERGGYVETGRRRVVVLRPLPAKW